MPQVVEIPGQGTAEFPDDMSQEDIASTIHENFFKPEQPAAAPTATPPTLMQFTPGVHIKSPFPSAAQMDAEDARQANLFEPPLGGIPRPFGQQQGTAKQVGAGIANFAVDAVNFAASPGGIASLLALGGAPRVIQGLTSLLFGAQGVEHAVEAPTLQEKVGGVAQAALAGLGMREAIRPRLTETLFPEERRPVPGPTSGPAPAEVAAHADEIAKAAEAVIPPQPTAVMPQEIPPPTAGEPIEQAPMAEVIAPETTSPVAAASQVEPPAAGTVRIYHGSSPEMEQAGSDFTTSLQYAQGYADKSVGDGGRVWYVDVPEGSLKTHDEYGQPMSRVVVPDEVAAQAKVLEERAAEPIPAAAAENQPGAVSAETSGSNRAQQGGEIPQEVVPPAEEQKPISITSIKNEQVDAEHVARGLEPAAAPVRKAFGESWDQATAKIDTNPEYPTELIDELRTKPRALTDVEDATLLHRQVDLQNQFDKTGDAIIKAQEAGDESSVVEHRARLSQLSDQLLDLYNIGKSAGTETGRGLAARRLLAAEDFSLANMLTKKRAINDGKPLTPEQETQIRDLHGQIGEAEKTLDDYLAESELRASEKAATKEASKLKGAKTRLEGQQYDLEQKLAFQDTSKAARAEPIQLDEQGQQLKANVERLKQQFWQNLQTDRLAKRTPLEKAQDTFTKWRRAFVLSSPVTLAKLTSAAAERMIFTPLEEAAGAGIAKLPGVRQAAARAPLEGPSSIRAEAAAVTEGFTKGMRDAVQLLKTGKSDLDVLYGKKNVLPKEAVDFIGTIHGALKTIPKRAEFARAFQKQVEFGLARGVDVTDPLVQSRYAVQAYKQANKSIFMQDNRVVNAWQSAMARLQQPDKATGRVPVGSKALATTAKTLLPIVRVPTNIVAETMQYALGTVSGSARLFNAFRRGIDTLRPEEADLIMRELKKGSVGAATMLLGYFNADKVGGYYQPGQKRDKEDVKFGGVRIFDHDVPSYLVHNPLLETLQIGATIRRVADSKLRKKDEDTQGVGSGVLAAGLGLTEEVPFVKETLDLSKAFDPHSRGAFFGELAKSVTVPAALQWAAQQNDRDDGDPIKRQADGILEHIQSGIPGLREQLPEKKSR